MKKISFVIPCYCSEKSIAHTVADIEAVMLTRSEYSHEIILVNDSSPDGTFDVIRGLCAENDNIVGINFMRNFGQHSALMAGYNAVRGDIIVSLDDDGQTPPSEVFRLVDKLEEGYDAVYARYPKKKHSFARNFGSRVNDLMARALIGKPKELYQSSYFAATRLVIDAVTEYKNPYPYMMGLVLRSAGRIVNVDVEHHEREDGHSGYTLSKLFSLWLNGFTAFSIKPLRIATFGGILFSLAGFVGVIWTIVNRFTNPDVPLGYSSLFAAILMIGGLMLFMLGLAGEYIGRLYMCVNSAPQYLVRENIDNRKVEK